MNKRNPDWRTTPMSIASSKCLPLVLILAWVSSSGSVSFGQETSSTLKVRPPAEYSQFAMQNEGDAAQGGKLFADEQRLGCSKCHSVDGRGSKAGPDLATVGDQFARRDLIDADGGTVTPDRTQRRLHQLRAPESAVLHPAGVTAVQMRLHIPHSTRYSSYLLL